jgi:hypothetical protein
MKIGTLTCGWKEMNGTLHIIYTSINLQYIIHTSVGWFLNAHPILDLILSMRIGWYLYMWEPDEWEPIMRAPFIIDIYVIE